MKTFPSKELRFNVPPVPAARVKVSRWGNYYPKTYETFRKAMAEVVSAVTAKVIPKAITTKMIVWVDIYAQRPKTTKLQYPKPDVDNYAKAVLDSLNEVAWDDDQDITGLIVTKQWAKPGEDGYFLVNIQPYDDSSIFDKLKATVKSWFK